MIRMQVNGVEAPGVARDRAKPTGELCGIAQIHGGSEIIQASAQFSRARTAQRARGEVFVMAQPLQFLRRK